MEQNQPNERAGDDAEWKKIQEQTPGLSDAENSEKEEDADEKEEEESTDDTDSSDDKEPAESEESTDKKEDDKEEDEATDPKEKKPARPEKYIPVAKYTDEKKKWKETDEAKDRRIKELETLADSNGKDKETKLEAYAEKHGKTVEEVRELVEILKEDKPQETTSAKEKELDAETTQLLKEAQESRAEKLFAKEFEKDALPALKILFPDATTEQLDAAKGEVSKLATTKDFLDKPLDHIVLKSKDELKEVFAKKPISKGPEGSERSPSKGATDYTAGDFKVGGISFDELGKLPAAKQAKIVEDMDIPTYDRYTKHMKTNDPLVINRGGRKVGK